MEGKTPQKYRILSWLTHQPVCSTTMLEQRIPRGAARISDLKKEGWEITKRECTQHEHRTYQIEYVLGNSPGYRSPQLARYARPPKPVELEAQLQMRSET